MQNLATDIPACEARIAANRRLAGLLSRGGETEALRRERLLVKADTVLQQIELLSLLWDVEDEKAGFRPDQPRHPRGSGPISGRWSGGAGTIIDPAGPAAAVIADPANPAATIIITPAGGPPPRWGENLLEHEAKGGHTVSLHVGKSEKFLRRAVSVDQFQSWLFDYYRKRHGSFSSIQAAQRLTNSNLSRNAAIVNEVATGQRRRAYIESEFSSVTGIEAFRTGDSESAPIVVRQTFGVGTLIEYAPDMPSGFIIITSYPRND